MYRSPVQKRFASSRASLLLARLSSLREEIDERVITQYKQQRTKQILRELPSIGEKVPITSVKRKLVVESISTRRSNENPFIRS